MTLTKEFGLDEVEFQSVQSTKTLPLDLETHLQDHFRELFEDQIFTSDRLDYLCGVAESAIIPDRTSTYFHNPRDFHAWCVPMRTFGITCDGAGSVSLLDFLFKTVTWNKALVAAGAFHVDSLVQVKEDINDYLGRSRNPSTWNKSLGDFNLSIPKENFGYAKYSLTKEALNKIHPHLTGIGLRTDSSTLCNHVYKAVGDEYCKQARKSCTIKLYKQTKMVEVTNNLYLCSPLGVQLILRRFFESQGEMNGG